MSARLGPPPPPPQKSANLGKLIKTNLKLISLLCHSLPPQSRYGPLPSSLARCTDVRTLECLSSQSPQRPRTSNVPPFTAHPLHPLLATGTRELLRVSPTHFQIYLSREKSCCRSSFQHVPKQHLLCFYCHFWGHGSDAVPRRDGPKDTLPKKIPHLHGNQTM